MDAARIARLLPEIYQATTGRSGPLDAFLAAQEQLHEPCETAIDNFASQLDPRRADSRFVFMLAHWLDVDYLLEGSKDKPYFAAGVGRLRELIATTARNGRARGTSETLVKMLETATGCSGFRVETAEDGTFHMRVTAPATARNFEKLVRKIITGEKPAFATYELHVE